LAGSRLANNSWLRSAKKAGIKPRLFIVRNAELIFCVR
jgi:hypothetical protein